MNAFIVVSPYVGMGATSSNVNGNLRPHTIIAVNENEITTTLDIITEDKDDRFKTDREGNKIQWVKKDNANPSESLYLPKNPTTDRYTDLVINKKQFYTNNNL